MIDIRHLPGLKERDLQRCASCGNRHEAAVLYRVTVETFGLDLGAIRRQIGLGMMMGGNAAIAQVMGPDEDMAKRIDTSTVILCLDCATRIPVLAAMEGEK